jgi:hypothetical protein
MGRSAADEPRAERLVVEAWMRATDARLELLARGGGDEPLPAGRRIDAQLALDRVAHEPAARSLVDHLDAEGPRLA